MSTNIKTIISTLTVAAVIATSLVWPAQAVSPDKVRMWQRILPLPCGVDHISDIDGVDHYFAPRACGRMVVAPNSLTENSSALLNGGGVIAYLDPSIASNAADAYLLVTAKSMVYKFRLSGESQVVPYRTMEVLGVDTVAQTVQLRFTPGDKLVTQRLGERTRADIAFDGAADLDLTFTYLTVNGRAVLHVWFPGANLVKQAGIVRTTRDTVAAALIMIMSMVVMLSTSTKVRRRTKRLLSTEKHWHLVK